ncbi:MAG: FxsA family protein [Salinibacter sp.]
MLGRLLLLFLLTPAVELGLLIQVDRLIGFWPTIGLIVATGIAGSYLARREGLNTWRRLNERLNAGDLPGKELIDGVIILMAGALLVTPGVLTDAIGFLGLLSPTRALIRKLVMRRFRHKMEQGSLRVQFGFFGGAAPGPNGPPPEDGPDGSGSSPVDRWQGTARQVPSHGDDGPAEESSPDATSDRSNGR